MVEKEGVIHSLPFPVLCLIAHGEMYRLQYPGY